MQFCPDCGCQLIHQEGCALCPYCGYSACGGCEVITRLRTEEKGGVTDVDTKREMAGPGSAGLG